MFDPGRRFDALDRHIVLRLVPAGEPRGPDLDAGHPLHLGDAVEAGDEQAQRAAVLPGQGGAVHRVGEHHFRREGVGDGEAAGEAAGVGVPSQALVRGVGAEEDDFAAVGAEQGFEERGERRSFPAGGADEAVHADAAVAAALEGRDPVRAGQGAEGGRRQRPARRFAAAADFETELRRRERGNARVVEDEEVLVRDDFAGDAGEIGVSRPGSRREWLDVGPRKRRRRGLGGRRPRPDAGRNGRRRAEGGEEGPAVHHREGAGEQRLGGRVRRKRPARSGRPLERKDRSLRSTRGSRRE